MSTNSPSTPSALSSDQSEGYSRCLRCGRPLENPESRRMGVGPVCKRKLLLLWANKEYEEARERIEQAQKNVEDSQQQFQEALS